MRKLALIDQLFMIIEDDKQPMHVGGVFLFEMPTTTHPNWTLKALINDMQASTTPPTFPFNQVLHHLIFWKTDDTLDIDHHFRYIDLPAPISMSELHDYISHEQARRLDRSKPLWECQIIRDIQPDVDDGDDSDDGDQRPLFALYIKVHHALLDGVAAMRLVQKYLSTSPNDIVDLPIWSRMAHTTPKADDIQLPKLSTSQSLQQQVQSFKPVFKALKTSVAKRHDDQYVSATQAPPTILNQSITGSRQFTSASFDIARFKRIAAHFNVSLNDVALTLCSGALRQYLLSSNHLPDQSLIACVPTSLRDASSAAGNQLAFVLCNLATDLADPIHRLKTIHQSMQMGKERFSNMTQVEFLNYGMLAYTWEGVNLLTNLYPQKRAFNLIISNIKGSQQPLYWNGAKLKTLSPVSVVLNGLALNITLASYADQIEFGIIGCADTIPAIHPLTDFIAKELSILEKMGKTTTKRLAIANKTVNPTTML